MGVEVQVEVGLETVATDDFVEGVDLLSLKNKNKNFEEKTKAF